MYKVFVVIFMAITCSAITKFSLLLNTVFFYPAVLLMSPLNITDSKWEQLTNVGLECNVILKGSFMVHFPPYSNGQNMLTIHHNLYA
jgi:hypothetical protein